MNLNLAPFFYSNLPLTSNQPATAPSPVSLDWRSFNAVFLQPTFPPAPQPLFVLPSAPSDNDILLQALYQQAMRQHGAFSFSHTAPQPPIVPNNHAQPPIMPHIPRAQKVNSHPNASPVQRSPSGSVVDLAKERTGSSAFHQINRIENPHVVSDQPPTSKSAQEPEARDAKRKATSQFFRHQVNEEREELINQHYLNIQSRISTLPKDFKEKNCCPAIWHRGESEEEVQIVTNSNLQSPLFLIVDSRGKTHNVKANTLSLEGPSPLPAPSAERALPKQKTGDVVYEKGTVVKVKEPFPSYKRKKFTLTRSLYTTSSRGYGYSTNDPDQQEVAFLSKNIEMNS